MKIVCGTWHGHYLVIIFVVIGVFGNITFSCCHLLTYCVLKLKKDNLKNLELKNGRMPIPRTGKTDAETELIFEQLYYQAHRWEVNALAYAKLLKEISERTVKSLAILRETSTLIKKYAMEIEESVDNVQNLRNENDKLRVDLKKSQENKIVLMEIFEGSVATVGSLKTKLNRATEKLVNARVTMMEQSPAVDDFDANDDVPIMMESKGAS